MDIIKCKMSVTWVRMGMGMKRKISIVFVAVILAGMGWLWWNHTPPIPRDWNRIETGLGAIHHIALSEDEQSVLLYASQGDSDRRVLVVVNRATQAISHRLMEFSDTRWFHTLAFSGDQAQALVFESQSAGIWDVLTGQLIRSIPPQPSPMFFIGNQGGYPAIGTSHQNRSVVVFDALTSEIKKGVQLEPFFTRLLAFSSDGGLVLAEFTNESGETQTGIWYLETGQLVKTFPESGIERACFSPSNEFLLTTQGDMNTVKLWNYTETQPLRHFSVSSENPVFSFSSDSERILLLGPSLSIRATRTGESLYTQPLDRLYTFALFGHSKEHIVTGNDAGVVEWLALSSNGE
jgi:hypothetical protein